MARPRRTMIRKNPLFMEPQLADVEERPLDIIEIKKKAYPQV